MMSVRCINVVCAGAQDDLKKVTEMAYDQIRLMGMNEKVGLVSFPRAKEHEFLGQPYSQQTTQLIDDVSQFLSSSTLQFCLFECMFWMAGTEHCLRNHMCVNSEHQHW